MSIASITTNDRRVEAEAMALLESHGMRAITHGSVSYALSVDPPNAMKARQVLLDHAGALPDVTVWPVDIIEMQLAQPDSR